MKKLFHGIVLKLQLLSFGTFAFLIPWFGVQHLEKQRTNQSEEKKAAQERELQFQQEIATLNQQVSIANKQISQKDAALKTAHQQIVLLAAQKQQASNAEKVSSKSRVSSTSGQTTQTAASTPVKVSKPVARSVAS